jgi:hypothetical protein
MSSPGIQSSLVLFLIPLLLLATGLFAIAYRERKEKANLSPEDRARLSSASSRALLWRLLPVSVVFIFPILKPRTASHGQLLTESLFLASAILFAFVVSTIFSLKALARAGLPEDFNKAMKRYAVTRLAMIFGFPLLVFSLGILPLFRAILINFFHSHTH